VLMFFLSGVLSEPRRYAVQLPGTEWVAGVGLVGAVLVGIGGLFIGADIVRAMLRPARSAEAPAPTDRGPAPATA
jgi:hypothetical protein